MYERNHRDTFRGAIRGRDGDPLFDQHYPIWNYMNPATDTANWNKRPLSEYENALERRLIPIRYSNSEYG